jgi:5-formyltetrahydrofolate cyclo-ligase
MLKKDLRSKYKQLRKTLIAEKIDSDSIAIANNLLKLDIWNHIYYHLFLTIKNQNEIDTEHLLNILFGKNKEVVISKSNFETRELTNFLLTENTRIKTNEYDIPEPVDGIEVPASKIEVVFVPLLAYDLQGNRVGYGKGFYDKFLKNTNAIAIGLSFFEPEKLIKDREKHDIKLDYCITPKNIHRFK